MYWTFQQFEKHLGFEVQANLRKENSNLPCWLRIILRLVPKKVK